MAFDGSGVEGTPSEISLKFETWVADSPTAIVNQAGLGPFVFYFKLPFHPGKNVNVGQTVEAAGIPITLEKVVVTPAGTGVVLRFYDEYEDTRNRPLMITSLEPPRGFPDNSDLDAIQEAYCSLRESYSLTYYRGDFTDRSGEWTLTVTELVFVPRKPAGQTGAFYSGKASDVKRLSGPWVFHFEVP